MPSVLPEKNYARIPVTLKLPDLIEVQLDSFVRLKRKVWGIYSTNYHRLSRITRG
jgi:hypothetical protein